LEKNTSHNNNENANRDTSPDSESDLQHLIEKPDTSSILSIRKDLLFILIFVGIIFAAYLSPLKQYIDKAPELCEQIKSTGYMAPVFFILGVCLLVCVGVPRLLLCPLGGMAFGFVYGLLYCVIGTLMAYYIVFLFVRWGGRDFILRHSHKLNKFTKILEHGGIPAVILARQMPVHGMVLNLIMGLSPVSHRDFLIGTAIGLFPEAIPFTLIGKGAKQGSIGKSMIYIFVALLVLVALWLGAKLWRRKRKSGTGHQ
jgi:uncharacterized membrane protein YdjX (TVP38/TMEM64 family)